MNSGAYKKFNKLPNAILTILCVLKIQMVEQVICSKNTDRK